MTKLHDRKTLHIKSEIAKILNSEENSKRKIPIQMANSIDTHQTNGQQL